MFITSGKIGPLYRIVSVVVTPWPMRAARSKCVIIVDNLLVDDMVETLKTEIFYKSQVYVISVNMFFCGLFQGD